MKKTVKKVRRHVKEKSYAKPMKFVEHRLSGKKCVVCGRAGGDLKISCPGYRTAGDAVSFPPKP